MQVCLDFYGSLTAIQIAADDCISALSQATLRTSVPYLLQNRTSTYNFDHMPLKGIPVLIHCTEISLNHCIYRGEGKFAAAKAVTHPGGLLLSTL